MTLSTEKGELNGENGHLAEAAFGASLVASAIGVGEREGHETGALGMLAEALAKRIEDAVAHSHDAYAMGVALTLVAPLKEL